MPVSIINSWYVDGAALGTASEFDVFAADKLGLFGDPAGRYLQASLEWPRLFGGAMP